MSSTTIIHFVITGGTIDSHYEPTKDTAVPNIKSIIPDFIKGLNLYSDAKFTTVCMKDSRQLTQGDQKKVLRVVEKSVSKKIIITHGTYTMSDTARYLKANLKRKDQIVVLTGSMIPISGFAPSDGPFSLGYAVAQLEHLPAGLYVCMNGRVFRPEEVSKVIHEGRFVSLFNE